MTKFRRILPAAASVIALTATVAFARDCKKLEETEGLRIRVSERGVSERESGSAASNRVSSIPLAIDSETGAVYQVEIMRGDKTNVVLIEAKTGRVVRRMDHADKVA